eukprot:TRINITY_DN9888_c0_g1_i11.p1 TRINITY_DN9888_c0_g1~~TRINITY_DN9888_c0_g1_i11.p1  ORF type:complete len:510 (-),score=82.75 TRINITY_DN9888_c0_g1_i11:16-1521(-)
MPLPAGSSSATSVEAPCVSELLEESVDFGSAPNRAALSPSTGWEVLQLHVSRTKKQEAFEHFHDAIASESVLASVLLDPTRRLVKCSGHKPACCAMIALASSSRHRRWLRRDRRGSQSRGLLASRQFRRARWSKAMTKSVSTASLLPHGADQADESSSESPTQKCLSEDQAASAHNFLSSRDFLGCAVDLLEWMKGLPDHLPIASVSMPGTHDTATFQLWPLPVSWQYVQAYGQTQEWDLEAQFAAGVRFLDLRVRGDGWLYHGPLACALSLEQALQACAAFLREHRSEFLLVRLKDEEQSSASALKIGELIGKWAAHTPLCCLCDEPRTVGQLRGKLIVLQDWAAPDISLRWAGPKMAIQDFWNAGSASDKWKAPRVLGRKLCVNFVSAQSFPRRTPRYFAGLLNPKLCTGLLRGKYSAPGVVVLDFPTRDLCAAIVATNFGNTSLGVPSNMEEVHRASISLEAKTDQRRATVKRFEGVASELATCKAQRPSQSQASSFL